MVLSARDGHDLVAKSPPPPPWSTTYLMLKLKLQYFGHHAKSWLIGKDWCWEGLGAGGEGDNRGWDGWMASLTWWTWVWVNSGSWWWTGRAGVLQFMGSQRVGHDWATELKWLNWNKILLTIWLKCVFSIYITSIPLPLKRFWTLSLFNRFLFELDFLVFSKCSILAFLIWIQIDHTVSQNRYSLYVNI